MRSLVKEENREVLSILLPYRRQTSDLAELQVELRRFVSSYRAKTQENFEFKRLTHRVTSLQGTNRTAARNSEPLQLRLTVDQHSGIIKKGQYERRFTAGATGKYEVVGILSEFDDPDEVGRMPSTG